ncbi:hypothetical protein [Conyzicola nivalis]|uniref:hypothetical protein n=1 Tax=Conyzicola nivalis TaxID=1477021 RepID=UPI00166538B1|nr:hypothetical protein [Conyzicola nivalis]
MEQLGPRVGYTISWYDGVYSEANYTIVPLADGKFTVYRPSGRGSNFPDHDFDGREVVFDSEDAACDYVWAKITHPKPEPEPEPKKFTMPSAAELAEQRRVAFANLGIADPRLARREDGL